MYYMYDIDMDTSIQMIYGQQHFQALDGKQLYFQTSQTA